MSDVLKRFTLIDFLGIFTPGAMILLCLQMRFGWVTEPCVRFFGENDIALFAYFIWGSYLLGTFLHHAGWLMEWTAWKLGVHYSLDMQDSFWIAPPENVGDGDNPTNPRDRNNRTEAERVISAYRKKINSTLPATGAERIEAGRKILHYVQRKRRPERIVLFSAFYSMHRTMSFSLLSLAGLVVTYGGWGVTAKVQILAAMAVLLAISVHQWWDFDWRCVEEAYMIFTAEASEDGD